MPRYLVGAAKRKLRSSSNFTKGVQAENKCDDLKKIKKNSLGLDQTPTHESSKSDDDDDDGGVDSIGSDSKSDIKPKSSDKSVGYLINNSENNISQNSDHDEVCEKQDSLIISVNICKPANKNLDELDEDKRTKCKKTTKGPSLKVFRCHLCLQRFKSWNRLKKHCKEQHNTSPQITCTCGKPLFTRASIIEHRAKHLGRNIFECDKCDKVFYRKSLLNLHVVSHLPKEQQPFVCCKCARRFHSEALLKNHERVHLPKEEKLIYPCHLCRKMFSSSSAVSAHLKAVHLGERPFVCDQCGHTFTAKGILQEHLTTHSDSTPWSCTECSKSFKTKYRLKIHMDIHRGTPYQCPKCPTQLSTKRTLRMHLIVHGETKAYQCSVCGKAFKRAKDLKNHNTLHTGKKPYTCPFCFRTFANGSNCRSHKRRMHPEELQAYEEALQERSASTAQAVDLFTSSSLRPMFYDGRLDDAEQGDIVLSSSISRSIQSSGITLVSNVNQTLSSCYSNVIDNDIFDRPLVSPHSIFKDTLYSSQSENSVSNVPAFPGNPYVYHKRQIHHHH